MNEELEKQLNNIINTQVPSRPSYFQLRHFVLGKEPTTQAKLKRCVEELRTRNNDIFSIKNEINACHDKISLLNKGEKDEIKKRMVVRQAEAIERQIYKLQTMLQEKFEECQFFVNAYNELIRIEPHKPWDDPDVQLEYWEAKLGEDVRRRMQYGLPLDMEVIRTILSLPKGSGLRQLMLEKKAISGE